MESLRIREGAAELKGALVSAIAECVGDGNGEGCSRSDPAHGFGAYIAVMGPLS